MSVAVPQNFQLGYSQQQVGGSLKPLPTSSLQTSLQDADPTIFFALDFWSALIRIYEEARLLDEATRCSAPVTQGVAQRYPWLPDLQRYAAQFKFPLLAVYRKESAYEWKRIAWEDDRVEFDVLYILPPLTPAQTERLVPILRSIEATIRKGTTRGFDPNYTPPGGTQGQQPWTLKLAGLEEIGFTRGHYSTWEVSQETAFPMLHMEGYVKERDMYVPASTQLAGVDTEVDLFGADGTIVANLINTSTQQAPTIASLSPATGPIAGGQTVTVTGTLFLSGPVVYLGTQRVYVVTYNSASSLTIVTPAYQDPGSVSLTIINRDGQSVALQNAYLYHP